MTPMVSIIVPVYNTKKYLRRCADSLIGQDYENLEILFIDDGSSDGSESILDEYQRQDARVRVIHQENAGVSASRNRALDLARGEYIQFADSDDWLPSAGGFPAARRGGRFPGAGGGLLGGLRRQKTFLSAAE